MTTNETTDVTIESKARVFLLGSVVLPDTDPTMPVADVLALYTKNYPVLENATVGIPKAVGDELHYEINPPPAATKG